MTRRCRPSPRPAIHAAGVLLLPLVLSACSAALGVPGTPVPDRLDATSPAPADISGRWEGIYNTHPQIIHLSFDLVQRAGGVVEGSVAYAPLTERFSAVTVGSGRYAVMGTWDATTRTLRIAPDRSKGAMDWRAAVSFTALYDSGYRAFAGLIGGTAGGQAQYVVLARPEQAEPLFLDPARNASEPRQSPGLPFGIGASTDESVILEWAGQLTREFPGRDPYREVIPQAENLYADPYFEPFFGTTYDRLNSFKRRSIFLAIGQSDNRQVQELSGLSYAFQATGLPAVQATTVTVLAHRVIRSWMDGARERMAAAPPTPALWSEIAGAETAAEIVLPALWPSERVAFTGSVEEGRARVAGGLLAASLDETVSAGMDLETAARLHRAMMGASVAGRQPVPAAPPRDPAALWSLATDEARRATEARAGEAVRTALAAALERDRQRVAALAADVEGLAEGTRWYRQASIDYAAFAGDPAVGALFDAFGDRRIAALRASAPSIEAYLRDADDPDEIGLVLAGYLGTSVDRLDPVGSRLLDLGEGRIRELRAIETREQLMRRAVLKLAGAFAVEMGRRSIEADHPFIQALVGGGRDALIASAFRDVIPDVDDRALGYMVRLTGQAMSGDLSLSGMTSAAMREYFVQQWAEANPDAAWLGTAADLLVDAVMASAQGGR